MSSLSLLGLFAHPDDEQLMSGVFAQAALEGIRTGLICATRGEMGEIADPALATPENLGQVREAEMRAAATVIGVKHLWFLDYRDSGMLGTPPNEDERAFLRADRQEALRRIVKIVREFKPTVMVTFDSTGAYGHPDHITIYELATQAFSAAADHTMFPEEGEPRQAARLFYTAFQRSSMRELQRFIEQSNMETGFRGLDPEKFGLPDEEITHAIDVKDWVPVKAKSVEHHRTQMNPNSPMAKMPPEFWTKLRSTEYFQQAAGVPAPDDPSARGDLFAGLR